MTRVALLLAALALLLAALPGGASAASHEQASAAAKRCGKLKYNDRTFGVRVHRGKVRCLTARRVLYRWLHNRPLRRWHCFLAHGRNSPYAAVCAPAGRDPDRARKVIRLV